MVVIYGSHMSIGPIMGLHKSRGTFWNHGDQSRHNQSWGWWLIKVVIDQHYWWSVTGWWIQAIVLKPWDFTELVIFYGDRSWTLVTDHVVIDHGLCYQSLGSNYELWVFGLRRPSHFFLWPLKCWSWFSKSSYTSSKTRHVVSSPNLALTKI